MESSYEPSIGFSCIDNNHRLLYLLHLFLHQLPLFINTQKDPILVDDVGLDSFDITPWVESTGTNETSDEKTKVHQCQIKASLKELSRCERQYSEELFSLLSGHALKKCLLTIKAKYVTYLIAGCLMLIANLL